MIYETKQTKKAAPLFKDWQESLIWSCLQGVMGTLYVDSPKRPASAMIILGDFCYLAGKPDSRFILHKPYPGMIMVPQDDAWSRLIEDCGGGKIPYEIKKVTRYAIKKEPGVFDTKKLQAAAASLPEGYTLKLMDETLFHYCHKTDWCRDWVSQYDSYALYQQYGLGAVAFKDGVPVSGASSYSGYRGGIEVEIITHEDHRRKGLAYACAARLILECLKRDWYPSWDARTKWSAALAEKLGYHFDHAYTAYEIPPKLPSLSG